MRNDFAQTRPIEPSEWLTDQDLDVVRTGTAKLSEWFVLEPTVWPASTDRADSRHAHLRYVGDPYAALSEFDIRLWKGREGFVVTHCREREDMQELPALSTVEAATEALVRLATALLEDPDLVA